MHRTPPNLKTDRVSAILFPRVIFLTLLAALAPPGVNAYYCGFGFNDKDSNLAGLDLSGALCGLGKFNEGCGLGCDDAWAGTYVDTQGASSVSSCAAGQFSGSGQSICNAIPNGYHATTTQTTPLPCNDGFYALGSTTSYKCLVCPAGSYCKQSDIAPQQLTGRNYALQGKSYKSTVLPGYMQNGFGLPSIPCASKGYYKANANDADCIICSKGYACPSSTMTTQLLCPNGFYSDQTGQSECTGCPIGQYCPNNGGIRDVAYDCVAGYFSLGYQEICTSCPAGYYCPTASAPPVLCSSGTTSTGAATRCLVNNNGLTSTNIASSQTSATSTCTIGQYYLYNGTDAISRCNDCPIGHYCPSQTQSPIPCDSGYYSSVVKNSICTLCPAGSACAFPHLAPVVCPTFGSAGSSGYTSDDGATGCYPMEIICNTDEYKYPNPSADGAICPEGYACYNCYAAPTLCPRGYYSAAGAEECTLCEAGYMCPSPYASMKTACVAGYYSAEGSLNCYPIPDHMITLNTATRPGSGWCKYGEYSALTANDCQICAADQQCLSDSIEPIDCPMSDDDTAISAFTSSAYELSCFPRLATRGGGPLAATSTSAFDELVLAGFYSMTGGTHQFDCPKGRECLFPMENIFIQCPPGTYDVDGYFACQPCPEGRVCPIMQKQYIDNNSGGWVQNRFFSPYNTHAEFMIPAGWWTDAANNYMIRPCALGYYSADGATGGCTICPVGYTCPIGSNAPIRCNEGGESLTTGSHECTPCLDDKWYNPVTNVCEDKPDNTFSIHPIFAVQACQYNMQSDSLTFSNDNYLDCYETDGKYYQISTGSYLTCPDGFYCLHSGWAQTYTKFPCPPGTFASGATGLSSIAAQCSYCTAGSYCPGGDYGQIICPAGYICPEGTQFATQFPCPLATMQQTTGASLYSECGGCTPGSLCLEGTDVPFDCPPGTSCELAPWLSGDCQSGQYSNAGLCEACPAGQYCPTSSSYGVKCPSGTYTSSTGSKSVSDCIQATANYPVPTYGQTAVPTDYPVHLGYVYPLGTAFSHQIPCPAGQICDTGILARAWADCPSDYACPQGSSTSTAEICERGYSCPASTLDSRQFPQASGYYSKAVGSAAEECPAGFYCPAGTQVIRYCPLGFYCEAGTKDYRNTPCLSGTYGENIMLTASSECTTCPAGRYCQAGLPQPQLCPAGTFSTSSDSADSAFTTSGLGFLKPCTPCTAGYYCPFQGTEAALECGLGFFSPEGSMICFSCHAGHLCDSTTTTQTYMEANKCAGVECLTWAIYESTISCPSGYYCDEDEFQPLACPVGTYQELTISQASVATCVDVPAGYYNDEVGQILTQIQEVKKCSPGYTCAAGSISRYATPCPPGEYNDLSGELVCEICQAGFYCLGATIIPISCPGGYWCTDGVFEPTACPIGTYGANTELTQLDDCTTCTKGSYCAEPGIQAPTGLCNAGFYCEAGSIIPEENDCPTGGYCEQGSFEKTFCPAGYYNEYTNMKTFQDCVLCTPGQYCAGDVTDSTSGYCLAGWYCESGSRVDDQYPAEPGYYTLAGASKQVECPAKQYNPFYHMSGCTECPAGFYCDQTAMTEPTICPIGKYCQIGYETPVQCPVGTYNPVTGGTSIATHCLDCPPGRYCANKGLSAPSGDCAAGYFCLEASETSRPAALDLISERWGKCPEGYYCPVATSYPYPCPAGTFSTAESLTDASECTPCTQGYYCETRGLTAVTGPCDEGFYCPTGQSEPRNDAYKCTPSNYCPAGSPVQIVCEAGTYQHQYYQETCLVCPAGYYCLEGVTDPVICPAGAFCMESSIDFEPCPIGKYMPDTGASSDCLACTAGEYCGTTGLTATTGLCSEGYVCTQLAYTSMPSSTSQGGYKCQQGHYCPEGSGFQLQCPPGKACPNTGMTFGDLYIDNTYDCLAGYYCLIGAIKTTPLSEASQGGDYCTTGHYCPPKTSVPIPCEPGTYRGTRGGQAATDCLPCPAGSYCQNYGSTTYKTCDEGWYCETGLVYGEVSPTPWDSINSVPKVCEVGYYCTSGIKTACSSKYQDQIGQNSCKACSAGFQCTTEELIECGQSNYCPSGDMHPTKCADGYYTFKTTAISSTECKICPAGSYCTCTLDVGGSYCTDDATITPCPAGFYCAAGSNDGTTPCAEGYICPEGTFKQVPCPPGYLCDGTGNTDSTKVDCPAGSYCTGGSTSSNILTCKAGYYCEINSKAMYPCEIGTYNPDTGSTDATGCLDCPSGSTCTLRAQVADDITGFSCDSGYYCEDDSSKEQCPMGYYCPTDSIYPTPCALGYYTDNLAQASCTKCPAGYYCGDDVLDEWISAAVKILADSAIPCMAGQYCPKKSYMLTATSLAGTSCPVGTFNPDVGARNVGDCIDCPEGYLCVTSGLSGDYDTLTICPAGSYCPGASISKNAIQCPVGAYCPEGSVYYIKCNAGTFNLAKGGIDSSACSACTADYYCGSKGIGVANSLQLCGDGYLCLGGNTQSTPMSVSTGTGEFCPAGYYCSRVLAGQQDCPIGTYQPNMGQSSCIDCPEGQLCDTINLIDPNECPVGSYCPAETNSVTNAAIPCPAGSYNDIANIGTSDLCVPCEPGKYCNAGSAARSDAIDCLETFFCPYGATKGNAYLNTYEFGGDVSGVCPAGYNCPAGSIAPVPCEVGTWQVGVGKTTCDPCTEGYYCDQVGLAELTSLNYCEAGFYCLAGSHIPNPQTIYESDGTTVKTASLIGDICSIGNYCPRGSSEETQCAAGTYEIRTGSAECQECPAGYYCEIGCFKPIECQNGYCPAGSSAPTLCEAGTYGTEALKKLEEADDCPSCPNGKFCHSGFIQKDCDAGYFCDFGAVAWQDEDKICQEGHYCPSGTLLPIRCPETLYWAGTGARDVSYCSPCQAGYYCLDNDSVSRVCPKGHFCPEKTKEPIPCWEGFYNPYKRQSKNSDCLTCPAGAACNSRGIDDYLRHMCPAGHYCPKAGSKDEPTLCPSGTYRNATGASSLEQCWDCPAGHFCEKGSGYASPCDAGYYCPTKSAFQIACRPGFYCPAMSVAEKLCPKGYNCPTYRTDIYSKCGNGTYCDAGAKQETSCPAGQFGTSVTFNWNETVSCIPCGPGQYSDSASKTCQPCEAGYVCFAGATTARPNSPQENGQICDPGFYCLKASYSGIACPIGTYSNEKGNGQLNQCKPCPVDTFGNEVGQTSCQACEGGTVSEIGQSTCKCVGLNRKYLAQTKQCVCLSGYQPVDGSDSLENGFSDCQKNVYERCNSDEERDIVGNCRAKDDCAAECNGGTGTIQQNFGICQCDSIVTTAQICNLDCIDTALVTTFTSEGKVRIYDPITKTTVETPMPNTIGSAKCSEEDQTRCELIGVGLSNANGFSGSYDLPTSLTQDNPKIFAINNSTISRRKTNNFKGQTTYAKSNDNTTLYWDQNGRNLQQLNAQEATVITNPVVCTAKGSAVLFDSLSASTYPVYQKDSLLNTNQDFDYGAFNQLPDQLIGLTGQNFIFNFDQAGVYVFADSRNPVKLMIISVMHEDHKCPADSKFSPMTYASLLKVGAYQNDVLLPPDWAFFFITLIAFILLIVLAVLLVSWIARRDWKQTKIPQILYQTANYKAVERDDPSDNRAIVSINTDSSSFMFRAQGHDDGQDMGERLVDRMKTGKNGKTKVPQNQGPRGRKDLSLNQVETLKDALHKHLKEIKKLRALRYGKDGTQVQDELGNEQSDYTSSDEDELNTTIANVKKLIANARAVLRGEGEDEIQIFTEDTKMIEAINTADDKRAEREEAIRLRKEKLEEEQKMQDDKFKRKINFENDIAINELEDMKNKVLQMQVESAYDRGKGFQERMLRSGHKDEELGEMMGQLEGKMQRVEDLLLDDKDRQNDMLKRQLEQRRLRRRKLNEKLVEVDSELHKNEYQEADRKTVVVKELQEELKVEIEALDQEDVLARENLHRKYDAIKVDKLADYQDRLRNAGGSKDFQMILNQFQEAQILVDKELKRQIDKENDRLDRDLKARKAKSKAQAEIRRSQRFKELEIKQAEHMTNQLDGKAKIEEALSTNERKDEIMNVFTNRLTQQVNDGNLLTIEMERKRRDEETLRQEHERKQRKVQAEAMKDAAIMNKDVDDEIERIANADGFEPFQALVNERSQLQKQVAAASSDEERNLLLKQLKEVDDQVKNQLGQEAKDQDMALKRRLDARRLRRENAIDKEKVMKESLLQDRITYALENSTAFAVYRNDLTNEAFNKIVNEMKLELTPEEIPAAIENLVDDKHQKELSDWLLKLYEQKAIELKEEILTLMEEKIAKQQVLKKNFEDRKRGIDAILSRTSDPATITELTQRKDKLNGEMLRDVNKLETDFVAAETRKTREIQARSMDRETKALQDMSEMHFEEKKKIFEQYLPDSLMKDLFEELGTKEREQMQLYQKELEAVKQAKLKEMEQDELVLKAELANQQSILNKLSDEDQILAKKEMLEQRRQKQDKRQKYAVVSSQEVISKIRQDMEKGLEGLSGAYEEEHKRQIAMMEARLASRGQQVSVALEQKKIEMLRKQEQAELEHRKELDKVRECRKRKAQLLSTIQNGQKLMLKGCYSRPLFNYNKKLHDAAVKNDDISQLLQNQSFELKEQVMGRLLTKVSELEEKVSMDVNRKPDRNAGGLQSRLASRAGGTNDGNSNGGSDKVANAKAILQNLFKKKH